MFTLSAQGVFEQSADIGNVRHPGTVYYDPEAETYVISGSGSNMWNDTDAFHMVWTRLEGDFILYTDVRFIEAGVDPHRKAGIIIRKDLSDDAAYVSAAFHGDGLVAMQYRRQSGLDTEEIRHLEEQAPILQLERSGSTVIMSAAKEGSPLMETGRLELDEVEEAFYVGLFVCAHHDDVLETATFVNTRLVRPAPKNFVPYSDFLGSRVEVIDIETGKRKIVYESEENLEAPNWSPDGKYLVLNGRGRLFRLDIETQELSLINTGFATSLNNDHGISPDGKRLVISHHVEDLPPGQNSIIFTLPITGGEPERVTAKGPSYWHGWSPDGKFLIYTAMRNGQWDIYKIPFDGGEEIQLTNHPGLDDGSDYSADGKHIWYNSERSDTMEIWRMKEDGSGQEQITNDPYQNWFPHESPDGRFLVFLSYLPDVNPADHPYYKQVMLRIMNTSGLQPRVLVHLYGGQGTINVPSWSPDGKKIAFISNTGR